jgi:hypothetical protein
MAILHNCGFRVRFIVDNIDKEIVQDIDVFYEDMSEIGESQVEIKECSRVFVKFECQIADAVLEIQNIFEYNEGYLKISNGETKKLFEGYNKYSMLIPGVHDLRVKVGNKYFYSTFTITPRHINDMQLQNLREFVNSYINGLSYDIVTWSGKLSKKRELSPPDYINLYKVYQKEFPDIKRSIEEILRNPITIIEKRYERGQNTKKDDAKTIRFSEKRNRIEKLEVKKRPTVISKENIFVKSIILNMYKQLRCIESNLEQCKNQIGLELALRKRECESKEEIFNKNKSLDYKTIENERKVKSLNQSYSNLTETLKKIENISYYIDNTKKMILSLFKYINSGIFKEITETTSSIPTLNIFKDRRYNRLYRSYKNISDTKSKGVLNYKTSDILYEYFVLLVLVRAFKDMGFVMDDCDFKTLFSANFVDKIPEGCNAVFIKEGLKVEVWYEKELLSLPYEALQVGGGFYTHTSNRLPDIRIDFYKDGKFIYSLIVEVKYRRYSYLWNDYVNTDTMTQIKNYKTTVQYISKEMKKPIFPIEKVIVIYPGQHDIERLVEKDWGNYLFLQLRPGESENDIYGYSEFKNIIKEAIMNSKRMSL